MTYALSFLWHERQRFASGILVAAFSALLVALQCGLLLGMLAFASIPVDHGRADIWAGAAGVPSVDLGRAFPSSHLARLAVQPEVVRCEEYLQGFAYWARRDGSVELCMIIGSRLGADSVGAVGELTPDLRARLTEPGAVVLDESDLGRLDTRGIGDETEVSGRRVRVVGLVRGLRSFIGAYVFCSVETARTLLQMSADQSTFLLARCGDPADAAAVVARLRTVHPDMSVFTREELSARSRLRWLIMTKAGIALGYAAALGLVTGAVVTAQTLHAATAASFREYAVLWALGIPARRAAGLVLTQAFLVGAVGSTLSLPGVVALAGVADRLNISVLLPGWLLAATAGITVAMALSSSLSALRILRRLDPALLLR